MIDIQMTSTIPALSDFKIRYMREGYHTIKHMDADQAIHFAQEPHGDTLSSDRNIKSDEDLPTPLLGN